MRGLFIGPVYLHTLFQRFLVSFIKTLSTGTATGNIGAEIGETFSSSHAIKAHTN